VPLSDKRKSELKADTEQQKKKIEDMPIWDQFTKSSKKDTSNPKSKKKRKMY